MNTQLLLTLSRDWADEFQAEGFIILTAEQWDAHKELAKARFEKSGSVELYFGTNEFLEYYSYEEYIKAFKVSELTPEQYETFKAFFLHKGYSYEHPKGTMNVVPDKIKFGIIPMIKEGDDD